MKPKIDTILPIILSLVLPILRFYAGESTSNEELPLVFIWGLLSLTLYILWHFLWLLWEVTLGIHKVWFPLLLLLLIVILMGIIQQFLDTNTDDFQFYPIIRLTASSILFFAIQYAIKSQQNIAHLRVEKEQLQTEKYKTELQVLRSKIDPHFLFNTLNTLRIMMRNQHGEAEKFVISLSDFYRQTLKYNENF